MSTITIGIDPGLTGALAVLDSARGLLEVCDLPTCGNGTETGSMRRWLDAGELMTMLRDLAARHAFADAYVEAAMERPIAMPNLPAQTIGVQFDAVGCLRGALAARRIPVEMVTPNAWKRMYGLKADKDRARELALTFYRHAPVTAKKHHNRAEAILIARWLMRTKFEEVAPA